MEEVAGQKERIAELASDAIEALRKGNLSKTLAQYKAFMLLEECVLDQIAPPPDLLDLFALLFNPRRNRIAHGQHARKAQVGRSLERHWETEYNERIQAEIGNFADAHFPQFKIAVRMVADDPSISTSQIEREIEKKGLPSVRRQTIHKWRKNPFFSQRVERERAAKIPNTDIEPDPFEVSVMLGRAAKEAKRRPPE
jgi:hypothetical protein